MGMEQIPMEIGENLVDLDMWFRWQGIVASYFHKVFIPNCVNLIFRSSNQLRVVELNIDKFS